MPRWSRAKHAWIACHAFLAGSVEHGVYTVLERVSDDYSGGRWDFYALSNGGFFMAPHTDAPFRIVCDGNGFDGEVSAVAAGIIATLMALSHLSFVVDDDGLIDQFYLLREYAVSHSEAGAIFRAID